MVSRTWFSKRHGYRLCCQTNRARIVLSIISSLSLAVPVPAVCWPYCWWRLWRSARAVAGVAPVTMWEAATEEEEEVVVVVVVADALRLGPSHYLLRQRGGLMVRLHLPLQRPRQLQYLRQQLRATQQLLAGRTINHKPRVLPAPRPRLKHCQPERT